MLEVTAVTLQVPNRLLLEEVTFTLQSRESMALTGRSGSGKTSLLSSICGLTDDYAGTIRIDGHDLRRLTAGQRADLRLRSIGLVFQHSELFSELTVLDNVALPGRLAGSSRADSERGARELLERLDVDRTRDQFPYQLSGGERQRVAVARALINQPSIVIADEPTGSLDEDTAALVSGLLYATCRDLGAALLIATHDLELAGLADREMHISRYRLHEHRSPISSPGPRT